jgi:hypothetical protein
MGFLTVGQAAESLGCAPKRLTDMIYLRRLDVKRCPLVGGRRMIPRDYLPTIASRLRRAMLRETV